MDNKRLQRQMADLANGFIVPFAIAILRVSPQSKRDFRLETALLYRQPAIDLQCKQDIVFRRLPSGWTAQR